MRSSSSISARHAARDPRQRARLITRSGMKRSSCRRLISSMRSHVLGRVVGHVAARAHDVGALAEQPLAQVVADRAGAHAGALGELAHLQQRLLRSQHRRPARAWRSRDRPADLKRHVLVLAGGPGDRAAVQQLGDLGLRSSRRPSSTSSVCSPSAGPGRRAWSPGVRVSLTGTPELAHRALRTRLVELDDHLARARRARRHSASSSSSTGSRQQSCSRGERLPLLAGARS